MLNKSNNEEREQDNSFSDDFASFDPEQLNKLDSHLLEP